VQEEGISRIIDPGEFQPMPAQGAGHNGCAIREGVEPSLSYQSCYAPPAQIGDKATEIDLHQFGRAGMQRRGESSAGAKATAQLGLEITGQRAFPEC
jgi:hypothetical protein